MIMRNNNHHQEDQQHHQQQQQQEQQELQQQQQQEQYKAQHKSTLAIMSMKSQTQSVNLKNKENSTAIMRKQFTPISDISSGSFSSASVAGSIQDDNMSDQCSLTQAGLEEYNSRSYYDQAVFHHQKQSSYAQSEGYHSYVSSSDSSSATPFLDRLRQESELLSRQSHHWSQNDLSTGATTTTAPVTAAITTNGNLNAGTIGSGGVGGVEQQQNSHPLLHRHHHHHHHHHHHNSANNASNGSNSGGGGNSNSNNGGTTNNNSSESHSSTETLKWLGSMSDVSEASHATGYSAISGSASSSQLIVHSSRVLTPKRHQSESVLYMHNDQQLSPPISASNSPTRMPAISTSPNRSGGSSGSNSASTGAIYMSHHPQHYIPQTSTSSSALSLSPSANSSLTKGAVAAAATAMSSSSPTLLFPNHAAELNKSSLSVTISQAPSPNGSAIGIGATTNEQQQTLHQSLLSIAPLSPSLSSSATAPLQKSSSASPTLSMASLSVAVTSSSNLAASSSPSSSSSSFSSNTSSAMTTTSSSSYRNNHRLFPVSTYTEPITGPHQQPNAPKQQQQQHVHLQHSPAAAQLPTTQQLPLHYPQSKLNSPQPTSWQSVADRINDFERQQQHLHHHHHHQANNAAAAAMQKYTFIDPSKTHRVSNPALKAFQKNAVQSYFERQQQQSKENLKHSAANGGNNLLRPHSLQPTGSPKEVASSAGVVRNSLPNNVGTAVVPSRYSNHHQLSNQINNDISFPDCGSSPPPPPPPRSRSLMPVRRSSSASEYAEFRDQYHRAATQEKLQSQSVKNVTEPEKISFNDCGMPPPPPPPRSKASLTVRRTSSASEYAAMREKAMQHVANQQQYIQRQLSSPMGLPSVFLTDEWVPERPPKNPNLRIPSPDLPPPPALATVDVDSNLSNQDEPLPPPPPEILRQPPPMNKPLSPNRRNSFAGSPSRKAFFNALPPPPSIPKKPTNMDLMHSRPASSMAQQSNKAHKIILNEKLSSPMAGDHKSVMVARKRPHHNPAVIPISPIHENAGMNFNNIGNCSPHHNNHKSPIRSDGLKASPPPPPLKPRMPISSQPIQPIPISSKIRCNSKASYLPRQSLEKLSSTDPDHGSYKLTLTSNEDCVPQHHSPNNNNNNSNNTKSDLINGGSKCNNLPDVLPVGVKLQPSSPTSATGASQRYGSNNSLSPTSPGTPNYPPPPYPNMKMFITKPSMPPNSRHSSPVTAYINMNSSPNNVGGSGSGSGGFNRSQSYDASSPKYMSQSTIDLKKTQILETPEEQQPNNCHHSDKVLSPAQSESNINSFTPRKEFKEFHRSEVVRKLSLEERDPGEGRIVRAELVNTTLSNSEHKITRKDSLRENIEKITQLQSKLMSAHTHTAAAAKSAQSPPPPMPRTEPVEVQTQTPEPPPPESPQPPALPSTPSPCEIAIISQMEPTIDGLKLMQRTEVILRVNPVTNEVGSQTDELLELDANRIKLNDSRDDALQRTTLQPRQKHPIEVECDRMSKELAGLLPQNDRLLEILQPQSCKTPTDYIGMLYNPDVPLRPAKRDVGTSTPSESNSSCTPKFELEFAEIEVSLTNGSSETSCDHLIKKKEDLINQLTRKLGVLNLEQTAIAEETTINDELGSSLAAKVADKMRPIDATKFRTYIDDVGHITSLLLSLSGRLAKAENSLTALDEQSPESKILILKRDRLVEQLEEAKRLKEDIDRRGSSVAGVLEKNLTSDEFADYDYFINMKAKLIADSRDIADKIAFSKEHLNALNDALIQSDC
ncbi:protein Shroom [Episyrphus balteatus]|uniref:protein Shroom n=1 Tax=Episyrphus balteatus TaxID=286459 RepID=UPI0024864C94|nr:protein Shroom [Episyrphus balteatus]